MIIKKVNVFFCMRGHWFASFPGPMLADMYAVQSGRVMSHSISLGISTSLVFDIWRSAVGSLVVFPFPIAIIGRIKLILRDFGNIISCNLLISSSIRFIALPPISHSTGVLYTGINCDEHSSLGKIQSPLFIISGYTPMLLI